MCAPIQRTRCATTVFDQRGSTGWLLSGGHPRAAARLARRSRPSVVQVRGSARGCAHVDQRIRCVTAPRDRQRSAGCALRRTGRAAPAAARPCEEPITVMPPWRARPMDPGHDRRACGGLDTPVARRESPRSVSMPPATRRGLAGYPDGPRVSRVLRHPDAGVDDAHPGQRRQSSAATRVACARPSTGAEGHAASRVHRHAIGHRGVRDVDGAGYPQRRSRHGPQVHASSARRGGAAPTPAAVGRSGPARMR